MKGPFGGGGGPRTSSGLSPTDLPLEWPPRYRYNIDAMSIAFEIGHVVAQVSTVHADGFPIGQAANIVPVHVGISETEPSMVLGLFQEFFQRPRSIQTNTKDWFSSIGVVKCDFLIAFPFERNIFFKGSVNFVPLVLFLIAGVGVRADRRGDVSHDIRGHVSEIRVVVA